jgi:iron only hydrogenase large subunit-like protein
MNEGKFLSHETEDSPISWMLQPEWIRLMESACEESDKDNWYAHLQLGMAYIADGRLNDGWIALEKSQAIKNSAWAEYGKSVVKKTIGDMENASLHIMNAAKMLPHDISIAKEAMEILLAAGKDNEAIEYHEVRGTKGIKEACYNIAGMDIKVCVASGAGNAKIVMDKIAKGEADWTFVEIMGCPGGCVNGGGQPIQPQYVRDTVDLKALRAKALYDQDERMVMRKSHNNPVVKEVYDNYFKGGYGCEKAHHTLHTSYVKRKRFDK